METNINVLIKDTTATKDILRKILKYLKYFLLSEKA